MVLKVQFWWLSGGSLHGVLSRNPLYLWRLVPQNGEIVIDYFGTVTIGISCPLILVFHYIFFTMPSAVVLYVFIGVGGFLCSISSSTWLAGIYSLKFIYMSPSSASAA